MAYYIHVQSNQQFIHSLCEICIEAMGMLSTYSRKILNDDQSMRSQTLENVRDRHTIGYVTRHNRLSGFAEFAIVICLNSILSATSGGMSPEEARRSQKPYRYGMILLCFGALINWVGMAEDYTEPIRYAGVACIVGGAMLICTAMCCWLHSPSPRSTVSVGAAGGGENGFDDDSAARVIGNVPERLRAEKPPDYEQCVIEPPSYADALQLSPAALLAADVQRRAHKAELLAVGMSSTSTAYELQSVMTVPSYDVAVGLAALPLASQTLPTALAGASPLQIINVGHVTCLNEVGDTR